MTKHPRAARHLAVVSDGSGPTTEDNLRIAADSQAHDRQSIAAAPNPVLTTWAEVAASVDETTWQRILTDLSPATRAECEQLRPPAPLPDLAARQREALRRLARQTPAIHTTQEPRS